MVNDIEKEVNRNVKKSLSSTFKKSDTELTRDGLFNADALKNRLVDYFGETYGNVIVENIEEALKDIGASIDDVETEFKKQIKQAIIDNMKPLEKSVDTIDSELKELVGKVDSDNTLGELVKAKFGLLRDSRSELVASTAATLQRGTGQLLAWDKFAVKYNWLTMRDAKVRDSHRNMDMAKPNENGYFNVNGDYMKCPGGGSSVKENARCRCGLIPEMDD